jgi:hypothetical protein
VKKAVPMKPVFRLSRVQLIENQAFTTELTTSILELQCNRAIEEGEEREEGRKEG